MEYGMVSILIPKEYETAFRKDAKNTMQDAANALQWNIYQGLCKNLGVKIRLFNLLPCGSYPQYCKKAFIPEFSFDEVGKNLKFCNVKFIRNYFRTKSLKKALHTWCCSGDDPKTLFVYTASNVLLSAVDSIKKQFPDVHVCFIVADLPDMSNLSTKQSLVLKLFTAHKAKQSYSLLSVVDSFVLLTKHMAEYMQIHQPYCVMEGIATTQSEFPEPVYDTDLKTVFYAGTLHRKFGILNLVEAFQKIEDPQYRLVLSGTGDCENDIRKAAENDSRIQFLGQLPRAEVLKMQTQATVLVNPRQNNEEFTKYSFPSKNLEYLSSGIPFVAYKLDGIPEEYDDYILYVDDNDVKSLAEKIVEVCQKTCQERYAIGEKARTFVTEQKNAVVQTGKIISLLFEGGEKIHDHREHAERHKD